MTNLTPAQRLQRSHITLMRSPSFALLSGIMLLGESRVKPGVPTAYTDGRNKYYGEEFVGSLTEKQLNFVVAHENFHVLYKHMTTWRKLWEEDPKLTNMACDYVINQQIVDLDPDQSYVQPPDIGLCLDSKYRGWDAKQVYDDLKQQQDSGDDPDGGDGQGSFDEHGFDEAKSLSEQDRKELEQAVEQAARQGDILAGKLNGKTGRDIGAIPEPKVDWREQLQDFVQSVCAGRDSSTWRRPNRRWLADGAYMPSPFSESIGPVVIGVDTSGSIDPHALNQLLAEISKIVEVMPPERLHLLYWDTEVARDEVYLPGEYGSLASSTTPAGGGGTDPLCVQRFVESMNPKPELVVMLTDGHFIGRWPQFDVPVLWAMTTTMTAPSGKTVHIN
jgi:predicted metal-dependent peptidase